MDQALINEINTIYANKVLHDVGLCVAVFDLVEVGEGKVRYGDGCLWYKRLCSPILSLNLPLSFWGFVLADPELLFVVTFRMVVFRPFVSEVLLAKVKSSDEDGIRCMFLSILPASNSS